MFQSPSRAPHRPRRGIILLAVTVMLLGAGVRTAPTVEPRSVVLISIDGFRWDYMDRFETPNLDRLAARGVRAEKLIPSFPTKTFPNHYTIVTGLYPGHHGIIANNMWDDGFQASFSLSDIDEVENPRWWGGEPIWVTAEKQGVRTASYFWPGSSTPIEGVLPTFWHRYDGSVPNSVRVQGVLDWLALPPDSAPGLLLAYFSLVDDAGHRYGPDARQTGDAVSAADALVGAIVEGIDRLGETNNVDVIVVSDHGMAPLSRDRVLFLDDYVDMSRIRVVDWAPVMAIKPDSGYLGVMLDALRGVTGATFYERDSLPARFHYDGVERITPVVGVMDEGWSASTRDYFDTHPNAFQDATHGFDNSLVSMQALFVAAGPDFRSEELVAPFRNVDVYNLLANLLGVTPAPNDGDPDAFRALLQR